MPSPALAFPSPAPRAAPQVPPFAAAPLAGVRLGLVTTRDAFDALEAPWNGLFERAGRGQHMFQGFNWLWHWCNHFLASAEDGGPRLAVVTGHIGDRLVMVWPLAAERAGPVVQLGFMGEPVSQYGDALIDDVANAPALLRAALDYAIAETRADVVHLRRVRQDANVAPVLFDSGARIVATADAPFLSLADVATFEALSERQSKGKRRNRSRQRRRLADRGEVSHRWYVSGAEAEALAVRAFQYKRDWLAARGQYSRAFSDRNTVRFFSDVARADSHPAGCYTFAVACDGHPAAIEVGLRAKGRSAIHIVTYDLAYEKAAAGALLMEDSLERAIRDGMDVFDFLPPVYDYKLEWSDTSMRVDDWALPVSAVGRLYSAVYLGRLRGALKRGVEGLPLSVRRTLAGMFQA